MNYKERQKLKPETYLLATSAELRAYQKKHKISALRMAKMAKAKIESQAP